MKTDAKTHAKQNIKILNKDGSLIVPYKAVLDHESQEKKLVIFVLF